MRNEAIQLNVWRNEKVSKSYKFNFLAFMFKAFCMIIGLCIAIVFVYLLSMKNFLDIQIMPIKHIEIKNELSNERALVVKNLMAGLHNESFISVDLLKAQQNIQNLPWVDGVSLGRQWSDRIYIEIKESIPVAIWNDKNVGIKGNVFEPENTESNLPVFETSENMLPIAIKTYVQLQNDLAKQNLYIQKMKIDDRGSVSMDLDNTTRLILGSNNILDKNTLAKKIILSRDLSHQVIDMRYENGFAISKIN